MTNYENFIERSRNGRTVENGKVDRFCNLIKENEGGKYLAWDVDDFNSNIEIIYVNNELDIFATQIEIVDNNDFYGCYLKIKNNQRRLNLNEDNSVIIPFIQNLVGFLDSEGIDNAFNERLKLKFNSLLS